MKRCLILIQILLFFTQVYAYEFDVLLTKDRRQISCFIIEENNEKIVYMLESGDSNQYMILKSDILRIYYGERDTTSVASTIVVAADTSTQINLPTKKDDCEATESSHITTIPTNTNQTTLKVVEDRKLPINTGIAAKNQGVYVFTDSEPFDDYDVLGEIEIFSASREDKNVASSGGQYGPIRDLLIRKARMANPSVEGVILTFTTGGSDKATLIKFKTQSDYNKYALAKRYQGIYVFTDNDPIGDYEYVENIKGKALSFFPQYSTFRDRFVKKCAQKYKERSNAVILHLVSGGRDSAEAIKLKK